MALPGVLIIHGWHGPSPDHWQVWLQHELTELGATARLPMLPEPDFPLAADWGRTLHDALALLAASHPPGERVVCAHSLGAITWMREAASVEPAHRVTRTILSAPPSVNAGYPEIAPFFDFELDPVAIATASATTRLVHSDNDPYAPRIDAGAEWARPLGIPADLIPGKGHLNDDEGLGPWPAMADWVLGRVERLA